MAEDITTEEAVNKPIVWVDQDGVAHYRASSLYSCQNALLMARLGYDGVGAPAWLQERYNQGHTFEPIVLEKLRTAHRFNLYGLQEACSIPVGTTARIDGHVDALASTYPEDTILITHLNGAYVGGDAGYMEYTPAKPLVVDVKALAASTFASWCSRGFANFPYYGWQQSVYTHSFDADLCMAMYAKESEETKGQLVLGDGQLRVEVFTEPWVAKVVLIKKVMEIEKMAREEGATAIFKNKCSPTMYPCPYFMWHPEAEKVKLDDDQTEALAVLVHARMDAKRREDAAAAERKSVEDQIRVALGDEVASTKIDGHGVSTYFHGSSVVDWDAIGEFTGQTAQAAQEMFTSVRKSEKLSVKITAPKEKK